MMTDLSCSYGVWLSQVKILMEEVIRKHLGWLVVWGNVFGGMIGMVAKAWGY